MPLHFISADITTLSVDAVVLPCSPHPIITESLNGPFYRAAGDKLLAARKKLGALPFGQSAVSPAFRLPAAYAVHTAVPIWQGGIYGETEVLRRCYETILSIVSANGFTSLALPLLGHGTQGFPYDTARGIFLEMMTASNKTDEVHIYLVTTHHLIAERQDIHNYIAGLFTPPCEQSDSAEPTSSSRVCEANAYDAYRPISLVEKELASRLSLREKTFSSTLLSYIEERGLKEPFVYKKANIDRKLFSKIKTNPNYQPTKSTVLAFALALELSLAETNDFLRTAGYALTYSSKSDIIIEYFILKNEYDIFTINEALFAFGEPSLGSH